MTIMNLLFSYDTDKFISGCSQKQTYHQYEFASPNP